MTDPGSKLHQAWSRSAWACWRGGRSDTEIARRQIDARDFVAARVSPWVVTIVILAFSGFALLLVRL